MGEDRLTAHQVITSTRPTANELFVGANYVMDKDDAVKAANEYANVSAQNCKMIGQHGASLIEDGYNILTHCNAGWLAFVDYGSALAPVYVAHRDGKKIHVFADETRPRCQGARLTAWELLQEGVPHSIIADNAAGFYMKKINMVIVGADRIAANGDVVNKIGTYEKAVLAKHHDVPFYCAAPLATVDKNCSTGLDVPIEERNEDEVKTMFGYNDKGEMTTIKIAPGGSSAKNPAFDITPAELVKGYITEKGILTSEDISNI
jgi:S-methyl-5-thioribose-1-phosphate isomerase